MFTQNTSLSPTLINVTLQGLDRHQEAQYPWHVHQYPFAAAVGSPCAPSHVGGHYDPLAASVDNPDYSLECSTADRHLCEVGDLSGKFGALNSSGALLAQDDTLSLYGSQSIVGRSIVVHYNNTRYTCANIRYPEGGLGVIRYAPLRQGAIIGNIYLHQHGDATTLVLANLLSTTATSASHNWHVHESPVSSDDSSCASTGGHYNPRDVAIDSDYSQSCNDSAPLQCELGDLTGKGGQLSFIDNRARLLYTDTDLPIAPDGNGYSINNRSIVVHGPDGAAARLACANILELRPREALATFTGEVTGTIRFFQRSPFEETRVTVSLEGLGGMAEGYHVHKTPVGVGADQCMPQYTGGHWNPLGVQYDDHTPSTSDQYEVGDLSGKFGPLTNMDAINETYSDMNIPLFRRNSIVGRSIVIHYANGSRWVCANIEYTAPTLSATTIFAVYGHTIKVVLTQFRDDPFSDTTITIVTVPPDQPSVTSRAVSLTTTPVTTSTATPISTEPIIGTTLVVSTVAPTVLSLLPSVTALSSSGQADGVYSSQAQDMLSYTSPSPSVSLDGGMGKRDIDDELEEDAGYIEEAYDTDVEGERVKRQNSQVALLQWSIRRVMAGNVVSDCGALEQFLPAEAEL